MCLVGEREEEAAMDSINYPQPCRWDWMQVMGGEKADCRRFNSWGISWDFVKDHFASQVFGKWMWYLCIVHIKNGPAKMEEAEAASKRRCGEIVTENQEALFQSFGKRRLLGKAELVPEIAYTDSVSMTGSISPAKITFDYTLCSTRIICAIAYTVKDWDNSWSWSQVTQCRGTTSD